MIQPSPRRLWAEGEGNDPQNRHWADRALGFVCRPIRLFNLSKMVSPERDISGRIHLGCIRLFGDFRGKRASWKELAALPEVRGYGPDDKLPACRECVEFRQGQARTSHRLSAGRTDQYRLRSTTDQIKPYPPSRSEAIRRLVEMG